MKFESAVRKVVNICAANKTTSAMEKEESRSPSPTPPQNGLVKLTSTREALRQQHKTFPEDVPRKPHPSHYKTSPAATSDDIETVSPLTSSPPEASTPLPSESPRFIRPIRRKSTLELHENPAYHPKGGPDYLKILAKYKLFDTDERHGRI